MCPEHYMTRLSHLRHSYLLFSLFFLPMQPFISYPPLEASSNTPAYIQDRYETHFSVMPRGH